MSIKCKLIGHDYRLIKQEQLAHPDYAWGMASYFACLRCTALLRNIAWWSNEYDSQGEIKA